MYSQGKGTKEARPPRCCGLHLGLGYRENPGDDAQVVQPGLQGERLQGFADASTNTEGCTTLVGELSLCNDRNCPESRHSLQKVG